MTQTVEVDMVDSDQSDDSLVLFGSWQPTSGADVSSCWWLLTSVCQT